MIDDGLNIASNGNSFVVPPIKSQVRLTKDGKSIILPKHPLEQLKDSPQLAEYCWREVTQAMMSGVSAEEIQKKHPEKWELAMKHVARMAREK